MRNSDIFYLGMKHKNTEYPYDKKLGILKFKIWIKSRGESVQHLAYGISHFSKGFLAYAYEISDFLKEFSEISKEWFTPRIK